MYVFDTDHLSILQHQTGTEYLRLARRIDRHSESDFFVSVPSFHEQAIGFHAMLQAARTREQTLKAFRLFDQILKDFARLQVLPFDERAYDTLQQIRSNSRRVAINDMRIAAVAMSRGFVVLTRNTVDFGRIPGLMIEDGLDDDEVTGTM